MVKEMNIESITKDARSIADVLAAHKVFGMVADNATLAEKATLERWIAHEKDHFVHMVTRQIHDPRKNDASKLVYFDTGVIIEFDVKVVCDTALFAFIKVVPVLSPNPLLDIDPNIDYEMLKADIQFVREYNLMD